MNMKILQTSALIIIGMFLFLPVSIAEAVQISHQPNPATTVTETTAVIEWTTNEDSNSRVDYGISQQLGQEKTLLDFVKYHSIELLNLTPETRYYFQIMSIASSGDFKVDDNIGRFYSFITTMQGDVIAPEISNLSVLSLAKTTATLKWDTNEESNSIVYIWEKGSPPGETKVFPEFVTSHIVTVPAQEGKEYNYIIASCDMSNNCENSTENFLVGGVDVTPPEITANIPEYTTSGRITITGETEAYSKVVLYVNNELNRILLSEQIGAEGNFEFINVALPLMENTIKITARDQGSNEASEEYEITVDSRPPFLNVTGVPKTSTTGSTTITIFVDEPCTIEVEVGVEDNIPPSKVTGLIEKRVTATLAEFGWIINEETDFDEYAIYRLVTLEQGNQEWIRLRVTDQPLFADAKVAPGQSYSYRVSAVDKRGNEGPYSDILVLSLPLAGTSDKSYAEIKEVNLSYQSKKDSFFRNGGEFTKTIALEDGLNKIKITATDRGGNSVAYTGETLYDMNPPQIITHNLKELSPSYIPTVTVKGNASEKSIISVFINSNAFDTFETNDDGIFEFPIDLSRADPATDAQKASLSASLPILSVTEGEAPQAGDAGEIWINKVKLIATDIAGSASQPVEEDVVLASCGMGSWYKIDIGGQPTSVYGTGGLTPSSLNPRLMLDGQEVIAFPINLSYIGSGKDQILGKPTVRIYTLSQEQEKEYKPDIDWVSAPSVICDPKTQKTCLVQMNVRAIVGEENWTRFQKEENISNNHMGDCLTPGVGCLKIPMMIEINFKQVTEQTGPYPQQYYPGQPGIESKVQKQCWNMEIAIDPRVDPNIMPGGLLKGSAEMINDTINILDQIIEPLEDLKTIIGGFCLGSWAVNFLVFIYEALVCKGGEGDGSPALTLVAAGMSLIDAAKEESFNPAYAEIGVCALEYPGEDNEKKRDKCETCEGAIKAKRTMVWTMQEICDRLFCPSAPTFQKYIKENIGNVEKIEGSKTTYFKGSSCACDFTQGENDCQPAKKAQTDIDTIKRLYEWYEQDDSSKYKDTDDGTDKCTGPHTAKAKCCGTEYMNEWGSSCGLPFADEILFNEIKESLCLANQNSNQPGKVEGLTLSISSEGKDSVSCGKFFNAIAGFCEAEGQPNLEPVPTGMKTKLTAITGPSLDKDDKNLYICMFPPGGLRNNYQIKFCYPTTKSKMAASNKSKSSNFIPLQKQFGFYAIDGGDVSNSFAGVGDETKETQGKLAFCKKNAWLCRWL